MDLEEPTCSKTATLRRPIQIVKKRSGPLEDALRALDPLMDSEQPNAGKEFAGELESKSEPKSKTGQTVASNNCGGTGGSGRRRLTVKEKEKKRERWLLTRKTWKYMADAGRKLIPEGVPNRKEDIPKIEAHFQQMCDSEMNFVLWRRKLSYPGATRTAKPRLKHLLRRSRHMQAPGYAEQEATNNANHTIELLQSYLKLDEALKTTMLLGSKTVRPDQTASPSARRPGRGGSKQMNSLKSPGFFASQSPQTTSGSEQKVSEIEQLLACLTQSARLGSLPMKPETITPGILKDKVLLKCIYNTLKKQQLHRILSKHSILPTDRPKSNLTHAISLSSLFHFGGTSGTGSTTSLNKSSQNHTARANTQTLSKPQQRNRSDQEANTGLSVVNASGTVSVTAKRQRQPPNTLDLRPDGKMPSSKPTASLTGQLQRRKACTYAKQYNSCGTQTNFIPLSEIKRLAEEYKMRKREEALIQCANGGATDDDEAQAGSGSTHTQRRKSSIDNEDVSQSVSDTIKRYLRMARKKSVHEVDQVNRFKRVNYDRNLRNIRAKGEIYPPGMDEDLSKAVQTLDAWSIITLDFIRGNENSGLLEQAHAEWQKMLDERIQKKLEYEESLKLRSHAISTSSPTPTSAGQQTQSQSNYTHSVSSCSTSSAPTSPTFYDQHHKQQHATTTPVNNNNNTHNTQTTTTTTQFPSSGHNSGQHSSGIFVSGTQFLANLWHGNTSSSSSTTSPTNSFQLQSKNDTSFSDDLNKHGHANMQKAKSSTNVGQFVTRKILRSRSKSQTRPAAAPLSKWAPCDNNKWTSDNGDSIHITDTSLHKLSNIEAKLLQRVALAKINELNIGVSLNFDAKSHKRRILPKKKAITTSFFDIGKKEEQSSSNSVFGNSLDSCVANDRKRYSNLNVSSSDRGSRSSLVSLFRGVGGSSTPSKLGENVRSCESLPSSANDPGSNMQQTHISKSTSGYFSNLKKAASVQLSRSQCDVRRKSQEFEPNYELSDGIVAASEGVVGSSDLLELQVPTFVMSCISYLEQHGLQKVGLFRVSTSKKRVKQMRDVFDKNNTSSFEPETCPHDVATLLKEFMRDLPEALLCDHLYQAFLKTQKIRNRRLQLEAVSHLIKLLPPSHRDTLYVLLKFLAKVAACADDVTNEDVNLHMSGNKMDSNNLATVFAPNILRKSRKANEPTKEDDANEKESMSDAINVIRIMIDHYEELFAVPAELLDVVYSHMLDECPENLYFLCEQRNTSAGAKSSTDSEQKVASENHSKRLYTRESVMHQNDASRMPDAFANCSRETKRILKTSPTNIRFDELGLHKVLSSSDSRRQSTPVLLNMGSAPSTETGVLSASLQIPVPMPIATKHIETTGAAYDLIDLDNVFLDVSTTPTYCKGHDLISGTLNADYYENAQSPAKFQQSCMDESTFPTRRSSLAAANMVRQQHQQQSGTNDSQAMHKQNVDKQAKKSISENEPKVPASISNIGGAILRSKTADFERISAKTQAAKPATCTSIVTTTTTTSSSSSTTQLSKSPTKTTTTSSGASTFTPTTSTPNLTVTEAAASSTQTKQHLYKRQQLIQSASRFIPTRDRKHK